MGSIMSAISDDEDDYSLLCKIHGEKYNGGPYGDHARWLKLLHKKETILSFEEYQEYKKISAYIQDCNMYLKDVKKATKLLEDYIQDISKEFDNFVSKIKDKKESE